MFKRLTTDFMSIWWHLMAIFYFILLVLAALDIIDASEIATHTYAILSFMCLAVLELKTPTKHPTSQIEDTLHWNRVRGNTSSTLNWELEIDMLQEELDELKASTTDVDRFDALLDLKFVLIGSLGKMHLSATQIEQGYQAVLDANSTKSSTKNSEGKITKPINFVGPESQLQTILDSRS